LNNCQSAAGKGKLFWFFSVGFACRQKPNVLDRAVGFQHVAQRINSPEVDGESILKSIVKNLTIILPKSFILAASISRPVEWGLCSPFLSCKIIVIYFFEFII
jgi:hypothetical protein